MNWFQFLIFFAGTSLCLSSKILVMVPMPGKSHVIMIERVVEELANRGHEVTFITAFPIGKKMANLTEVVFDDFLTTILDGMKMDQFSMGNVSPFMMTFVFPSMGEMVADNFLKEPAVQNFLKSDQKFDLVLGEGFVTDSVLAGMAYKYSAPLAIFSSTKPFPTITYTIGNPELPAILPQMRLNPEPSMTLCQRLTNLLYYIVGEVVLYAVHLPQQEAIMRKYFGDDLPPLKEIMMNTSMLLVNYDHSFAHPRPTVPNMIYIGGIHLRPLKPLPQDLKKYFDVSKHGVIFFSLGSHIKSEDMPKEKIQMFVRAFSKLKYDVLWKFGLDSFPNQPKNLKFSKWLPQSDILGHPNLKLFITHGGLMSTTEAVYRGVPVLGMPIMGDQPINMQLAEAAGYGKALDYRILTEEILLEAINELIDNPMYREVAKERSAILRDQVVPPLDNAIYHIEHVIRHKGAKHLRSPIQDLTWYQYYALDVLAVVSAATAIILVISYKITCWMFSLSLSKKKKPIPLKIKRKSE